MAHDRNYNAAYYDAFTTSTADIDFYRGFVTEESRVLELGCGSGRVTRALATSASEVVGIDLSVAMLDRARAQGATETYLHGDITTLRLGQLFDLIIAPFRVFQALETDPQVEGFFEVVQAHLAPGGLAILNVFNPNQAREKMATAWPVEGETFCEQTTLENGDVLSLFDERLRLDAKRQVLYPTLIYRRYRDDVLIDEHRNDIRMRYYYPAEFVSLIESKGFSVVDTWGGYGGEVYGQGSELVVSFQVDA